MSYATPDELRRLLRIDADGFTPEDAGTAELLIELAQGVIEDETGQALERCEDTVILDGPTDEDPRYHPASGSRTLILPRWPVAAVASVRLVEEDEELVFGKDRDYTWSASGILHRRGGEWPSHDRAVEVVYTAGYAPVPLGPKRICLRLSAAGWSNPEQLSSETLGDHSRAWTAEALGMTLAPADVKTLGSYRART